MRQHKVYKHQAKGYYAVKVGFAWYGLFFNMFWLLFKGLFLVSFVMILFTTYTNISFFIDFESIRSLEQYSVIDWVLAIGVLSIPFLVGFNGNKWVAKNLENKGYNLVQTIPTASKKEAITQTQNEKSGQPPIYAAWGRQDSYQPGHRHIKKEK